MSERFMGDGDDPGEHTAEAPASTNAGAGLASGSGASLERLLGLIGATFGVTDPVIHWISDDGPVAQALDGRGFRDTGEAAICRLTVGHGDVLVIPDLREDPRTRELGCVTGPSGRRFYAGVPLVTPDETILGALDLFDANPGQALDDVEVDRLREWARLITDIARPGASDAVGSWGRQLPVELDVATGLRTRATLIREGQHMLDAVAEAAGVGVVKMRLDGMDDVVEAHGAQGARDVLQTAARRLGDLLEPQDLLARGDGDNFVFLRVSEGAASSDALEDWLDNLSQKGLARLAEPFGVAGEQLHLTASIGSAAFYDHSVIYQVVDAASAASLGSQQDGGNRAKRFTTDVFAGFRERERIEVELRRALVRSDFTVNYQPVVDMVTGAVTGAEALVRWPRADHPTLGPATFIPVAESLGMIDELGLAVFDMVCRDLAAWHQQGWNLEIAVNLSPLQLSDPSLADQLAQSVQSAGVPCSRIKLEVTEGALATRANEVAETLAQLRQAGFRLALDDFGTGYSSLARLIHLPFETLKVDRTFVDDCPGGPGAAVVTSVSALARDLGMTLIAEGVERPEQQRFLRDHGYQYAQGFLYARPMPAAVLSDYLAS